MIRFVPRKTQNMYGVNGSYRSEVLRLKLILINILIQSFAY